MKKIIHIDMDAFYASIEQRDHPLLKDKPLIVGGMPNSRGVVASCSYEARKFGIKSAMPSHMAKKLCKDAIFVIPRMEVYKQVSLQIREIFYAYTDLVEPLALDEAYLDVTENKKNISSAITIAKEIKEEIFKKTKLTASAGVSFNKFLAKIASKQKKPNGLTVITPKEAEAFIDALPIGRFFGIGKATEQLLRENNILTGANLRKKTQEELNLLLGRRGYYYYNILRNIGDTEVCPDHIRKSVGREITLNYDTANRKEWKKILESLAFELERILLRLNLKGRTLTLKITFADFRKITRSYTKKTHFCTEKEIMYILEHILPHVPATIKTLNKKTEYDNILKARLLGLCITNLCPNNAPYQQLTFF